MPNSPPKSAIELVMERLKQQDAESGVDAAPLTEAQTSAIAEARRTYDAGVAECRILHESALRTTHDPEARQGLDANYRRDLARLTTDRDRKIDKIRGEPDARG